ncbi:lipopolysaccharide biosynthesis protein [Coraliomargarita parva]|uniref:lipopolysaccharide biosynthesis protein n=1 Tax=Coraliomargarita parva TaxID=3014050 RepID=UPI0022B2E110|nr:hypothetical protein [Coraliomargarita parva]
MNLSPQRLQRWATLLGTYFFGQGATQVIQLICGFLLINLLSKEAYATFTIVMAIQSTSSMMVELGFTQAMVSLIGKRVNNPSVVGRYAKACFYYRDRMLLIGALVLLVVFYVCAGKYGWESGLWVLLWFVVVLSLIFRCWDSIYASVFLLRQEIRTVYLVRGSAGLVRLSCIGLSYVLGVLTAPLALLIGTIHEFIIGYRNRQLVKPGIHFPEKGEDISHEKRELLSQSLPRAPSIAFFAFEGQITIFLIGIFGALSAVAEVGALGRLGMLFVVLNRMGGVLVSPHFAKLESHQVPRRVAFCLGVTALVSLVIAASGYFFPQLFLLVLGAKYQHLQFEVFLVVSASAARLLDFYTYSICIARKYIYSWFSIADIVPLVLAMIAATMILDLSSLRGILYFSLTMVVVRFLTKLCILAIGLSRETQKPDSAAA